MTDTANTISFQLQKGLFWYELTSNQTIQSPSIPTISRISILRFTRRSISQRMPRHAPREVHLPCRCKIQMTFQHGPRSETNNIRKLDAARNSIKQFLKKRVTGILESLSLGHSLNRGVTIGREETKIGIGGFVEADYEWTACFAGSVEIFVHIGVVEDCGRAVKVHAAIETVLLVP